MSVTIDNSCSHCKRDGVGTYRTTFECRNCGLGGVAIHSLTHEKTGAMRCPRCACTAAHAGAFVEDGAST